MSNNEINEASERNPTDIRDDIINDMSIVELKTSFANHLLGLILFDKKLRKSQDFYDRVMYLLIYIAFMLISWKIIFQK